LNESSGWQLDLKELERAYEKSVKEGKKIKAIVVINPGNPTGSILNGDTIKNVIEFAVKNKLVVVADEVVICLCRSIGPIFIKKMQFLCLSGKYCRR
jgi:alanine transaminase